MKKNYQPRTMTTPTDSEFRRQFFAILSEQLPRVLEGRIVPDSICFSEIQQIVIEYFLKNCLPGPIPSHASIADCVGHFRFDLQKLSQGNSETLAHYTGDFESFEKFLDESQALKLRVLFMTCHQKRGGPTKTGWGFSENPYRRLH